ncbi:uncharacterized protein [Diadema setosum]|uniref:uncharacterized protein n=1 Tax=Diadema setosum TaxID=31175 RepID=UPI003B3ACE37
MGSPISPIVANLYMQDFETGALKSYTGSKPRVWLRYVDDTFVIVKKQETQKFFQHINTCDPNISFTTEECKDQKLAFLDVEVHITSDGSLDTTVYRKPTHTNQYLHFNSHHPLVHKLSVIRTLFHRADLVVQDPTERAKEKSNTKQALARCGYPDWSFSKAESPKRTGNKSAQRSGTSSSHTREITITIPYIYDLSEKIKRVFGKHGISTAFKPHNSLRRKLVHVKDKISKEKQRNLVYGVRCEQEDCQDFYIGETQQSLKARMSQHRRPSSVDFNPDSAVYTHLKEKGHSFNTKDVVILDREANWFKRGVKEAIWERVEEPKLNKKGGLRFNLSHTWDRAVREIPSRLSRTGSAPLRDVPTQLHVYNDQPSSGRMPDEADCD